MKHKPEPTSELLSNDEGGCHNRQVIRFKPEDLERLGQVVGKAYFHGGQGIMPSEVTILSELITKTPPRLQSTAGTIFC